MSYSRSIGQAFLINGLTRLNLHNRELILGICAGITLKTLESYLLNDLAFLSAQFRELHRIDKDFELITQRDMRNEQRDFTYHRLMKQLNTQSTRNLFRAISIYQSSQLDKTVRINLPQNKIAELSALVSTPDIMQHGGLHQAFVFLNFLDESELGCFLSLIERYALNCKIGFSISCNGHRIGLGYDPNTKSWTFIEPNQLPLHESDNNLKSTLCGNIFAACTFETETPKPDLCFTIRCLVLGDQKEAAIQLHSALENDLLFQFLKKISPKKTELISERGERLIHIAAQQNCVPVLRTLITNLNLNPNTRDVHGCTPLMEAANDGSLECIEVLLQDPRTRINELAPDGYTALYSAAEQNNSRIVALLLEHGADPYIEHEGWLPPPIAIAVIKDCRETFNVFIAKGVNLTKRDSLGKTPLTHAMEHNRSMIPTIIRHLPSTNLDDSDANLSTKRKRTAEKSAASTPQKKINLPPKKRKIESNAGSMANPLAFFTPKQAASSTKPPEAASFKPF